MVEDRTLRVGAAQTFPEWFDLEGTIQKIDEWLAHANQVGLDLVVFPETFISGYPYWRGSESMAQSISYIALLQESAIEIPSEEVNRLCQSAQRHRVNCVIGANELDRSHGAYTLYNAQLFISREGRLVAHRRKLMPTHSERVYWGRGDWHDIMACQLDIGRVGALICYEHHMGLLTAAMGLLGEEIHCGMWPGWWELDGHLGAKQPLAHARHCDIEAGTREYAIQNGTFVISCSPYAPKSVQKGRWASAYVNQVAIGGSSIINPSGIYVVSPSFDGETLVWSEIELRQRRLAKAFLDGAGHYSRFDILRLERQEELLQHVFSHDADAS